MENIEGSTFYMRLFYFKFKTCHGIVYISKNLGGINDI